MARRKRVPAGEVARPTGRRRVVELVKDLLILALICSAVYLAFQSQAYGGLAPEGGLLGLLGGSGGAQSGGTAAVVGLDGARPVRIAVYNGTGGGAEAVAVRYGVQYDTREADQIYDALGGFLNEALAGAGNRRLVTEADWRRALQSPGVYFDLLGSAPLEALYDWTAAGKSNAALAGSARHLALSCTGGSTAELYYINEEDGSYYAYETALDCRGRFADALAAWAPSSNGTEFAFEQEAYAGLGPYTMLQSERVLESNLYRASSPVNPADPDSLDALKGALGFPNEYVSGEEIVLWEGGSERVRVDARGVVSYHMADGGESPRYPVASAGEAPTRGEMLEAVSALVSRTVAAQAGAARVYLMDLTRQGDGSWEARFGYSLDGSAVLLPGGACAAHFVIRGDRITDYTLTFRSYEPTGETGSVLRAEQAAAALGALHQKGKSLELCYDDSAGGDTVEARWAAR